MFLNANSVIRTHLPVPPALKLHGA